MRNVSEEEYFFEDKRFFEEEGDFFEDAGILRKMKGVRRRLGSSIFGFRRAEKAPPKFVLQSRKIEEPLPILVLRSRTSKMGIEDGLCDWARKSQPGNRIGHKEMCLKARRASGQTLTTCSKSDVREHARCADAQLRRRTKRAGAQSTQARGARRRAVRAGARSTQARGRAGARCSRPSGPAFLFSFGHARKFAGRCRGGGAPGVGPQWHRASPAPMTHAKHLSHSRGGLKVSVAPVS